MLVSVLRLLIEVLLVGFSHLLFKGFCSTPVVMTLIALGFCTALSFAMMGCSCSRGKQVWVGGWGLILDYLGACRRKNLNSVNLLSPKPLSHGLRARCRHNRVPAVLLTLSLEDRLLWLGGLDLVGGLPRHLGLPHAVILFNAVVKSILVDLLILWHVLATLRVHIMREHILSIDVTSDYWVDVGHTIGVEGWLTEIGGEGRVWEPSRGALEVFSRRIWLHLVLGRLCATFDAVFIIDSDLPLMMIFLFLISLSIIMQSLV